MADSNVMSLFGMTPEAYQQQQNANLQVEALKFAQLDPFQQASMGAYMAGSRLGAGIGGLLGAEDPQLKAIRAQQSMLQGVDISDPAALRAAASKAMQSGQYAVASQLASKALDIEKEQSIIAKNMRERQAADPFQKLVESGKYSPESLAKYKESGDVKDLVIADKPGTSEFERLVDSLNLTDAQKQEFKMKRAQAMLSNDGGAALRALDMQLRIIQTQLQARQLANLPDSAIKYEEEDVSKIDALSNLNDTIKAPLSYLTPDKTGNVAVELSPKKIFEYNARNASGNSDEQSRKYAEIQQAVQRATNIKTDAAKGVQTDRDVLRFANELVAAFSKYDTKAMASALSNLQKAQQREQDSLKKRVNERRAGYKVEPRYTGETPSKVKTYNPATGNLE